MVLDVINYILGLGPSVMMPIIVFVLSVALGAKASKSFRSALTIGVGFIAINLVVGLLVNTLAPATEAMVQNLGVKLDVMDVGWPVAAAISFGTSAVVPWIFVLGILMNIIMLALNWTKTADIDMWNYWHFIFTAAFVNVAMRDALGPTGALALSIVIGLLSAAITFKFADWTAPIVQKYFELPGVSLPHFETVGWAWVSYLVDKLVDRIPGINKIRAEPAYIQQRFGVLGESLVVGAILGLLIALLGFGPQLSTDFGGAMAKILNTAINMGAVMMVLPRMVRILMEGLLPLSDAARDFITRRFPGREIYIGLDAAVAIGHPAAIATGLLMVPLALGLALLLNLLGVNRMLPFADLAVLPFFAIWAVGWSRGNIFRGVINGTVFLTFILIIGTNLAPYVTQMAQDVNFAIPQGAIQISALDAGAHLTAYLLALPFLTFLTNGVSGMLIVGLIVAAVFAVVFGVVIRRSDVKAMVADIED